MLHILATVTSAEVPVVAEKVPPSLPTQGSRAGEARVLRADGDGGL